MKHFLVWNLNVGFVVHSRVEVVMHGLLHVKQQPFSLFLILFFALLHVDCPSMQWI